MKTALGSLHQDKRQRLHIYRVLTKRCLVIVRGAGAGPGAGDHAELTRALCQNHPLASLCEDHILTL